MVPEVDHPESGSRPESSRPTGAAALFYSSLIRRRPAELPSPKLPFRLGELLADGTRRYELVSVAARGSQAVVYRARDRKIAPNDPEPRVAVKLYPRDVDPSGTNQALVEARKTLVAQDLLVITILDASCTEEGWPYLVMPLLKATDLRTWRVANQKNITTRTLATIGRDLAHALESVHKAQLLHCDISPQNILIDSAQRPILADFGCALDATGSDEAIGGTPAFMAPERFLDARPSRPSDVAELCAVLYWLATGEPPHGMSESDIARSMSRPADADARRRRMLASARIDPSVAATIRRGLATVPEDRPTAVELKQEFVDWLSKSTRFRRSIVAIILVAIVAVTVATTLLLTPPPKLTLVDSGSHEELRAIAAALGASTDDSHVRALWARGRSADVAASAADPRATLAWVMQRSGTVMQASAVGRWTVALLAASVALECDDIGAADQWLPVAEAAYEEENGVHALAEQEPRLLIRLRSLVAAARMKRERLAEAAVAPNAVEALSLIEWMEAGIEQGWPAPQGSETPNSQMLKRILDELPTGH